MFLLYINILQVYDRILEINIKQERQKTEEFPKLEEQMEKPPKQTKTEEHD